MSGQEGPVLVIDASNVCRDDRLHPVGVEASWGRIDALLDAIDRSRIIDYVGYFLVADESLRNRLSREDRDAFDHRLALGELEQLRVADTRLVELTFGKTSPFASAVIASNDYLDDFRRSHPEIDHAMAVSWGADDSGRPTPVLRPFGERAHQLLSGKEEEGELKRRRLERRRVQDEAARWYFRCRSTSCALAQFWPERLEELPAYDSATGQFVCPGLGCGRPLERLGERRPAVLLVVFKDGDEAARLLVEDGVEVGRSDASRCIGLSRFFACPAVSRHHVRVSVERDDVFVEDLGSKNGSALRRRRSRDDLQELRPRRRVRWALRDVLELPDGITIERSGRRLPFRGEQLIDDAPDTSGAGETALVSRRRR